MPEPTPLSQLLPRTRPLAIAPLPVAKPGECPDHPGNPAAYCGPCAGERKAVDPNARWEIHTERVRRDCDRRFPRRYRDAQADHPAVLDWTATVVKDPEHAPSLLLLGPVGVGKTHQAYGALRTVAPELPGRDWIATRFPDLLASLRPEPGGKPERRVEHYREAGLLLLDDLGVGKTSEWVEETTYRLIDGRYLDMRPSIFTTNLGVAELRDSIGDRIASRLAESCRIVVLDGPDRRRVGQVA
ncbi:ATP-binding protein [Micromonospora sp. WMMD1102]|uniref:ATP-binding protein n=1 Tax=Micromonospora sp. WMMD1102 TaxID=3016105 RepID=UPI002414E69A|nr:ATP-binding protein [Micromonospora sp. WMMD1102]MDG4788098.1 ATP-binding protein [Micromonospora sp. WMMD1102]